MSPARARGRAGTSRRVCGGVYGEAWQGLTPKPHAPFDGVGPTSPNLKRHPGLRVRPVRPEQPRTRRGQQQPRGSARGRSGRHRGPAEREQNGGRGGEPLVVQKCASLFSCPGAAACTDARWEPASSISSRHRPCSTTTPSRARARRAAASPVAGE